MTDPQPSCSGSCILTTRGIQKSGYGHVYYKGKNWIAHRLAWFLANGKIPKGKLICHKCNVRNCINVKHLYLGTYKTNYEDTNNCGNLKIHPKGEKHLNSKLREYQVFEIRKMLETGKYAHRDVARKYGVSKEAISGISTGRNWLYLKLKPINPPRKINGKYV